MEDTVYPGNVGKKINEKVKAVLERNCGWQDVKKISNIHSGQQQDFDKEWMDYSRHPGHEICPGVVGRR
ncbi:hypothetical protein M8J77_009266 [Diaphorina citri]|nr:hypothetical protein M8J77_009266 [Diaphorina citri]